jgi:hypothetical protein
MRWRLRSSTDVLGLEGIGKAREEREQVPHAGHVIRYGMEILVADIDPSSAQPEGTADGALLLLAPGSFRSARASGASVIPARELPTAVTRIRIGRRQLFLPVW